MAEKNSHTGLWITFGALAAVGAGYLVWRYFLSDEQKQSAREAVVTNVRKVRGANGATLDQERMEELPIGR